MEFDELHRLYLEAQERHPGMLLLLRQGDWYDAYGDDARTLGKALGYAASTWRDANTIGFHANDLESSLRKLLHAGHRVAICDQIQDPAPRGAEVNRIVTPGYGVDVPRQPTLFDLFD